MVNDHLIRLLQAPAEQRGIEYKGPGRRDDSRYFAVVTQAVLAMANRRDGGVVIVGVDEDRGTFTPTGLAPGDLETWQSDAVKDKLAEYADPSVDVTVTHLEYEGKSFVALEVREFEDLPVACRKDYSGVLRRGAFYGRPRRKPESLEVSTQADMRDLIELATEKRLRQLLRITAGAGATISSEHQWERPGAIAGAVSTKLRSRGYWTVEVRPAKPAGVVYPTLPELEDVIAAAEVRYFGWRFPRLHRDAVIERHGGYIELQTASGEFLEAWRMAETGQFLWLGGCLSDWRDEELFRERPLPTDWEWGTELGVAEAIACITLAVEFAARLGASGRMTNELFVEIALEPLRGRTLVMDMPNRSGFSYPRTAAADRFAWRDQIAVSDLVGREADVAAGVARQLMALFRWDVDDAWCRQIIDGLRMAR